MKKMNGIAVSVIGSSHIQKEKPCQDYSCFFNGRKSSAVIVCDGHGGEKHFRSESGARIASEVICDAVELFAKNVSKGMLHAERQKRLKIFEKNIVYRWRKAVEEDVAIYPFTDEELKELSDKDKQRVKDNIWLAYGTTLQCVIKVENYWYVIKLGDGNIVGISGDMIFEPIDQDPRLKFNYTTSLCGEDAFDCIKDAIIPCAEYDAFIITSDGVYNSFDDKESYYGLIRQIYESRESIELKDELNEFLPKLSQEGSGDDLSVGLINN